MNDASTHMKFPGSSKVRRETVGLWLGVLGVAFFGVTLPATRLATGTAEAPQLSPWFVTLGRAALAGVLSVGFLFLTKSPWPGRTQWKPLGMALLGNLLAYPLLLAYALRTVTAGHAAVITALLPLVTSVSAALVLRQRARTGFWACAAVGSALVVGFASIRSGGTSNGWVGFAMPDLLLAAGVIAASVGYVYGAKVTPDLGAERVICWVCVLALPVTVPAAVVLWPMEPISVRAWIGFVYLGVFSMWVGFFAWYRGLAMGGALRVGQVQLLQPFFAIGASIPLLGEPLDYVTVAFAIAVVLTVIAGRKLA